MKKYWNDIKSRYWNTRSKHEQQILMVLIGVSLLLGFYLVLWRPAHSGVAKLQNSLPMLRVQATRLQQQAIEVEALRHRPKPAILDADNLKAAIEASAQRQQLRSALTSISLQDEHTVRLTFDSVPFSPWLKWLRNLQREQNVRAETVSVTATPQPGYVSASLTLTNEASQ
ncbi:MAG TPA: type II secretion system protein M [Gallionellaceae bacterium]